ncbi:sphingosine 1-phosphate receptor 2-like [Dendronephthya gigantea]|uniref:sphingosine 1-phosphate receptor 2-like n=1 Tax=Dendronephthya gigantea TaxID=151771 RepID=UPI00106C52BC|nr:sphingosine 1-phosphate receptor 2-like [Dendronephthya gigantea]
MNQSQELKVFEVSCRVLGTVHSIITNLPTKKLLINQIIAIVFNAVLIVPTILLNGVAVVTILKCNQLKSKPCYFIILLQSVNDLAVGVLGLPSFIYFLSTGIGAASNCIIATLAWRSTLIPMAISVFTLLVMTMERYIAILHPYAYVTQMTKRRLLIFVCTSVAIGFTASVLSFAFNRFLKMYVLAQISIVFIFIGFAYTRIFLIIRKLKRSEARPQVAFSAENMTRKKLFLQEIKQAKSCFIVVLTLILSYLPTAIFIPFSLNVDNNKIQYLANKTWSVSFGLCNSSFNSIVFFWTKTLLRKEIFKLLKGIF